MFTLRVAVAAHFCATLVAADTLNLRNGNAVEGNYLGGTAREIRMEIGDRVQTFPVDTVVSVQFSGGLRQSTNNDGQYSSSNNASPNSTSSNNSRSSVQNDPPQGSNDSSVSNGGYEIPAGTQLTVRMIDPIDSETSRMGDNFRASIDEPVMVNGQTVLPRGADVVARLVDDQKSGKIQGRTVLKLILTSVSVNGRMVDISTEDVTKESGSRGARSAKVIGGTAALGAVLGGIAGGGRGAAIGAGSGAAVGTGAQVITNGQRVRIPSETRLVFTLINGVRV